MASCGSGGGIKFYEFLQFVPGLSQGNGVAADNCYSAWISPVRGKAAVTTGPNSRHLQDDITIAFTGSGGSGVIAVGEMLLRAAARVGFYGLLRKSFGPQIRGGESAAILRLAPQPVAGFADGIDLLVVLDWSHFSRFGDELILGTDTCIIEDAAAGVRPLTVPAAVSILTLDFTGLAGTLGSAHNNIAALGYCGAWLGCSAEQLVASLNHRLQRQDSATLKLAAQVAQAGMGLAAEHPPPLAAPQPGRPEATRWLATGNQLAALGALEAGIRFVAAYPITPASDVLEWLATHIDKTGGRLVQAEDELAAVNMAIGAGYGGVPAMTATSGPGLALIAEAMGLAVASETPLVVLNVMRGGPSTGIPTKSEQGDFNLAVYGLHGDAPHVVLSALSPADCHFTLGWATAIASHYQTLAVVLSDQLLGQSMQVLPAPPAMPFQARLDRAALPPVDGEHYLRYLDTGSGISPMAVPGDPGAMYTADGLEHSIGATPSAGAGDHQQQLSKRQRKLMGLMQSEHWAEGVEQPEARLLILGWGSCYPVALEAQSCLEAAGVPVNVLGVRLLAPLPWEALQAQCAKVSQVLVIEQNHQGQFARYLRGFGLQCHAYHRPGPRLLTALEIQQQVEALVDA